jgi:lysozyme family protein
MSDFEIAVALTLVHEGGFTNNAADPGGATNMGIEQRDLPMVPIQSLTVTQAQTYYLEHYWKPLYSQINLQIVASKLFDMGVLFGVGAAVKILQQVLGIVPVDGIFGPGTLEATNAAGAAVLVNYKVALIQHALRVVASNSTEVLFLKGWERRINS